MCTSSFWDFIQFYRCEKQMEFSIDQTSDFNLSLVLSVSSLKETGHQNFRMHLRVNPAWSTHVDKVVRWRQSCWSWKMPSGEGTLQTWEWKRFAHEWGDQERCRSLLIVTGIISLQRLPQKVAQQNIKLRVPSFLSRTVWVLFKIILLMHGWLSLVKFHGILLLLSRSEERV